MLPNDPVMLMSVLNTRLRDEYTGLEALAEGLDIGADEMTRIVQRLKEAGFSYDQAANQFR